MVPVYSLQVAAEGVCTDLVEHAARMVRRKVLYVPCSEAGLFT